MERNRISRGGWLAMSLAVLGGLIALVREFVGFRQSGVVDWGHVALAVGVPAMMCVLVVSRRSGSPGAKDDSGDAT